MTADRARRIGMRRLMKYLHQRRTYTATTSMLGWCHDFGDHIILSDDIPTGKTQSCLIDAMIYDFRNYAACHGATGLELRESSLLDTVSGRSTIIANAHAATGG